MNVTIVGVGALGSHLVQFLRNEDISITVIDFDRVERRNVASQFHSKAHVGKQKVAALQQSMQFLYGRQISIVGNKLTKANSEVLQRKAGFVIDCLDNGEGRRIIQNFARANGNACLHGALAADGSFGRVIWDRNFVIDDEAGAGDATCEDGEFLPFIALTAAYLARAAQIYIRDSKKVGFSISPGGVVRI